MRQQAPATRTAGNTRKRRFGPFRTRSYAGLRRGIRPHSSERYRRFPLSAAHGRGSEVSGRRAPGHAGDGGGGPKFGADPRRRLCSCRSFRLRQFWESERGCEREVTGDFDRVTHAEVVTSPATITKPVLVSVSQATRAEGSCSMLESSTASEI